VQVRKDLKTASEKEHLVELYKKVSGKTGTAKDTQNQNETKQKKGWFSKLV
jgi:cell division protein FtsI/penicillin-binding protein 2